MRFLKTVWLSIFLSFLFSGVVYATPSTTFWTPMTQDIQAFGVPHIGIDNYFTGNSSFPTDFGLTIGVLPWEKLQMEIGVDIFAPTPLPDWEAEDPHPFSFNAKIGSPEGALFEGAPALQVGIFNAGFRSKVLNTDFTNADIVHVVISKTLWNFGRFSVGPYYGHAPAMRSADGDLENVGYMVAWDYGFWKVKDSAGNEYNRMVVAADYASGKNLLGGGGFGLYYYFTKDISLLSGPVWFNDARINGDWKWTVQLDINVPILGK